MSTQYDSGGETNQGTGESQSNVGGQSTTGSGGPSASSSSNWGSARSDYGDQAYGGSLDAKGLGGNSYDDFGEGRRDTGSRGESRLRSARSSSSSSGRSRAGYSLGDAGSNGLTLLAGMVIGATLMYLLDPEQGGRRRALLRDKFIALSNDATDTLGKTSRDLRNRARGVIAETTNALGLGQSGEGSARGVQGESNSSAQQATGAAGSI